LSASNPVPAAIEPISRQDLMLETISRLAQLVGGAEPGSRLPAERELCEMFGVGRSTLREAVRTLSFIGAVQVRQGSGTFVAESPGAAGEKLLSIGLTLERCSVSEIIEVRRMLEVQAVRLAADRRDETDLRAMQDVMDRMAASTADPGRASTLDLEFHILLSRASHNHVLCHLITGLRPLLELWMDRAVNRREVIEAIVREHMQVLQAVIDRDPGRAEACMYLHLTEAAGRLYAVLGKNHSAGNYLSTVLGNRIKRA
jgi:GntR family transcriptional repressor for pyruvate dehydrogenase complex